MSDLIYVAVIGGFFLLALSYLAGCDALNKGAKSE
jgi:hypothetical protein